LKRQDGSRNLTRPPPKGWTSSSLPGDELVASRLTNPGKSLTFVVCACYLEDGTHGVSFSSGSARMPELEEKIMPDGMGTWIRRFSLLWLGLCLVAGGGMIAGCGGDDDDQPTGDDDSPAGDDDTQVGDDDTQAGDDDTQVGDDDTQAGDDDTAIAETPAEPTPVEAQALPGEIVITELMISPRALSEVTGEWFEVMNITPDKIIDLDGWSIQDAESVAPVVIESGPLKVGPGEVLVFANSVDAGYSGGFTVDYVYNDINFSTGNGDSLTLKQDDTVIDGVVYTLGGEDGWPHIEGHSLSLSASSSRAQDNDLASNWCAATTLLDNMDYGTPGMVNASCLADVDGDFYTEDVDCADDDPMVNPGMGEVPDNGTDDDCDGLEDEAPTYGAGALLVTEIMYNPTKVSDGNGEWFELFNTTDEAIDLLGFIIGDSSSTHVILESVEVASQDYAVLGLNTEQSENGGLTVDYAYPVVKLNNEYDQNLGYADMVRVMYDNLLVDGVAYSPGVGWPEMAGYSYSLDGEAFNATDNDYGGNWCLPTATYGDGDFGSPGSANEPCLLDRDGDGYVEQTEDCDDTDASVYPGAEEVAGNGVDDDCDDLADEQPPSTGLLVITEFQADPGLVGDDVGEYFEVYNTSNALVDIRGWTFRDDGSNSVTVESDVPLVVEANSYFVFGKSIETAENGGISVDYAYGGSFILSNGEDEIVLEASGLLVDSVAYTADWDVVKGFAYSLSPGFLNATDNDAMDNWCYASTEYNVGESSTDYGTPGAENDPCP